MLPLGEEHRVTGETLRDDQRSLSEKLLCDIFGTSQRNIGKGEKRV